MTWKKASVYGMLVKKHSFPIKQKGNPQLLVKNNNPNQHGEEKLKTLRIVFSLWGLLSFKTCQRSFSSENAVSLTSSHAAEPCCITMTQECPSLRQGNLHSATAHWGMGRQKKEEGIVQEWVRVDEGRGQTKGRPITRGHGSSASQHREIHHLQDQTVACAQGRAQGKRQPPMLALSFLSPLFTRQYSPPTPTSLTHTNGSV